MSLTGRLRDPEIVQDLEAALHERYWEGYELLVGGHLGAGIYLLGYSAEMALKIANFRFMGNLATDEVPSLLWAARARSRGYGLATARDDFHSLLFWVELLCEDRRQGSRPLVIETALLNTVSRLAGNWKVTMRYQPDCATAIDASEVVEDVDWLRANFEVLWR